MIDFHYPPGRISADPKSPDFHPYWSRWAQVFVDGNLVGRVTFVDREAGLVEFHHEPLRVADGKIVTARVEGVVTIKARPDAPGLGALG